MPTVLESLLHPVSPFEFREQYYGKRPLLIRGHAQKFAGLFTWNDLNRLLNSSPYPQPNFEVTRPGKRTRPAAPATILAECRAGASMILHHLHLCEPKVGELARSLAAETGEPMDISLFLSHHSTSALEKHYDRRDVFVLHLDGYKAWRVYDRTVDKPAAGEADYTGDASPREPLLECELAPGDVLYIPRGHWHEALAQRGFSLQLTVGMDARTGLDFMNWLMEELRRDVRFRHELPLSFSVEAEELRERRVREHVARLGDLLLSRFRDPATIERFLEHCVLADRDVGRFKFPAQLLEAPATQGQVRRFSRPARQRFLLSDRHADGRVVLSVWGRRLEFPRTARPLIDFIVSRTGFEYQDALAHAGELTEQGVRDVLDPLVREGILDAVPEV